MRRVRRARGAWLAILLAAWCGAGVAMAAPQRGGSPKAGSPDDARKEKLARAHFDTAERAFNLGKFGDALVAYEAAYQVLPLGPFLFNVAQCHRNLRNHERAVFFFERYLALAPKAPNRKVVEGLITEERRLLAEQKVAPAAAPAPVAGSPARGRALEPRADLSAPLPGAAGNRPGASPAGIVSPRTRGVSGSARTWLLWGTVGAIVLGSAAAIAFTRGGEALSSGKLGSIDTR